MFQLSWIKKKFIPNNGFFQLLKLLQISNFNLMQTLNLSIQTILCKIQKFLLHSLYFIRRRNMTMSDIKNYSKTEVKNFFQDSSIHGLRYMTCNEPPIVRGFWLILCLISFGYSVFIIRKNVEGKGSKCKQFNFLNFRLYIRMVIEPCDDHNK